MSEKFRYHSYSDVGSYLDVTVLDIRISRISDFPISYIMFRSLAYPGFPDAPVSPKHVRGHTTGHSTVFTAGPLPAQPQPLPLLAQQLLQPLPLLAKLLPRPGHQRRLARLSPLNAACQH
jgi:hypothetical protein